MVFVPHILTSSTDTRTSKLDARARTLCGYVSDGEMLYRNNNGMTF